MTGAPIVDVSAVIATADKRTAAQARNLFRRAREIATASHLKRVFEEIQARHIGPLAEHGSQPDLILLDMDMPNISGVELLEKLGAATSEVLTVIVASSGEEALRALRAGAGDYVLKPFRLDDLRTRIRLLLEQRAGNRQITDMPGVDAPLPHLVEKLHDPKDGHLDAKEVSDFFGLSVAELARAMGRGVSTVHKTPTAPALQEALRPFEAMASGLLRLTGSERRARMWLHASNPALEGHAPIEWLRMGKATDLAAFIQDLLEGRPA